MFKKVNIKLFSIFSPLSSTPCPLRRYNNVDSSNHNYRRWCAGISGFYELIFK